jgi:hypothetical protein
LAAELQREKRRKTTTTTMTRAAARGRSNEVVVSAVTSLKPSAENPEICVYITV